MTLNPPLNRTLEPTLSWLRLSNLLGYEILKPETRNLNAVTNNALFLNVN